jgi:hypothetical protein
MLLYKYSKIAEVFGDRFWIYAAEAGVIFTTEGMHDRQEARENPLPCAIHRIKTYAEGELTEAPEVKTAFDIVLVKGLHVVDFYLAGLEELFPGFGELYGGIRDEGFYFFEDRDRGGTAIGGFELVAQVVGGIVRGGEHNT